MKRSVLWVFLGLTVLGLAASEAPAQPAQVFIIRHAEKPPDRNAVNLSLKGQERAMALVPFVTQSLHLIHHGLPVALFATKIIPGDFSHRTLDTLAPLSQHLRVLSDAHYAKWEVGELAQEVLTNLKYERRTVLICWENHYIPKLAAALGVRPEPPKWPDEVFDRVFIITYRGGQASLVNMPQRLLFGDSPE
jgi:hypothetical protein